MALDKEYLYMQYFYNAVIEYIYFVILYIEGFGNTNLNTLCKHVKFFKVEVGIFILSFPGETFENKLYQMLNMLGYFTIFRNKIYINGNKPFKDVILNDLVISKCADLVLRGIDNIDAITESLNFNNVIYISKKNILDIIENSSYFSTKNKQIVSLLNIHGLLGFEDEVSNSLIYYFHGVLNRNEVLSYKQVKDRSGFLSSFCGIHNVIMILSILNSSKFFDCKNGYVQLKKKFRKCPKLKTIDLDVQARFSSRSMTVGQIVHRVYGSSLYKWTGEIGSINECSGMIYCVVNFSNGSQGIFNVCFNEASLKIISDTKNLKMYLKIFDIVEFDAKYYIGKNSERCWRASRLKVLHNKFEHDENLYDTLCHESKVLKNQCVNNGCCIINSNLIWKNFISNNCVKIKNPKYNVEEKLMPKIMKTSENKFYDTNDSVNKLDATYKNCVSNQKPSYYLSFSNLSIIDYSYMFGYIYMLMADKGMAIAEQGGEIFNIVFLKNSLYTPDKFENLKNGQKILALIPYRGAMDSFCVSTLVHGLSKKETYETEKNNVLPKDFAVKISANSVTQKFQCKFCNKHNDLLKSMSKEGGLTTTIKQSFELAKVYESILREYKVPTQSDYLSQLLFGLYKIISGEGLCKKVFLFATKIAKYFKKYAVHRVRTKRQKKLKNPLKESIKNSVNDHNVQPEAHRNDLCTSGSQMSLIDENSISSECYLAKESKSLDTAVQPSRKTPSPFETTSSSDSNESFYSCESNFSSPNISSSSLIHQQDVSQDLDNKAKIDLKLDQEKQVKTLSNKKKSNVVSESNQEFIMKPPRFKNLKQRLQYKNYYKYLDLKSMSYLKYSIKKKGKIVLPSILKSACRNCIKSTVNLEAYISMISTSFFFYTLNINGCSVTLPLSKQVVPPDLQGRMKLNSYSELTVIPNGLANLSHIIVVNTFT